MDDETHDDKDKKPGRLLAFPGGKKVNTNEIGLEGVIVGQSGTIPTPDVIDPKEVEADLRERESYVKRQELVQATDRKAPTGEIIDIVLKEIAEELGHLKYERRKVAADGKNTANFTVSRIASLRQISEVLLKRQENARAERMDFRSPEFKKVIQSWLEFIYESLGKAGMTESDIDLVFKQIEADMSDWEKRALENVS